MLRVKNQHSKMMWQA